MYKWLLKFSLVGSLAVISGCAHYHSEFVIVESEYEIITESDILSSQKQYKVKDVALANPQGMYHQPNIYFSLHKKVDINTVIFMSVTTGDLESVKTMSFAIDEKTYHFLPESPPNLIDTSLYSKSETRFSIPFDLLKDISIGKSVKVRIETETSTIEKTIASEGPTVAQHAIRSFIKRFEK